MMHLTMPPHNQKGKLITFCGLDGCGKTTMIQTLAHTLEQQNHSVFLTRQPSDFVRNTNVFRTYMDEPDHSEYAYRCLSLLAAGDRVQHVQKTILPALQEGKIVISDRYFYSCLANLIARGYGADRWIYEVAEWLIKPDLAIFLDVPAEVAIQRVRSRPAEKDRYIDVPLQHRLREIYCSLAKENDCLLLSTLEPPTVTQTKIEQAIERMFNHESKTNNL